VLFVDILYPYLCLLLVICISFRCCVIRALLIPICAFWLTRCDVLRCLPFLDCFYVCFVCYPLLFAICCLFVVRYE